ncbi:MAG TPA: periplasmic heavy metal sensor [Opitutaceae bacterium]|nr:periplasmic heavy metal sensor [Opitutaceae bacterium]
MLTLVVVLAAAGIAGVLCYRMGSEPELRAAEREGDPMRWLRAEFHLKDEQYARVAQLHQSYGTVCAEHCRQIQEATDALTTLKASKSADAAKLAASEQRVRELRAVCERSIEEHVREVAGCMSSKESERYLAMVLPRISSFDHSGPPDVGLRR